MSALPGIHIKIERAKSHLADYRDEGARVGAANAEMCAVREDAERNRRVLVVAREPVIPDIFGVIAGDAIQNLRAALDRLAYGICMKAGGATITVKQRRSIYFPIATSEAEFLAQLRKMPRAAFCRVRPGTQRHRAVPWRQGRPTFRATSRATSTSTRCNSP